MEINVLFKSSIRTFIVILIVIVCTLSMCSCATTRTTSQLVRDVRIDTVYLSNSQYDSIYIYKDRLTDRSKDTVYLRDISIEYRYKMLRDTVRIIQHDSIPYEVTITEVKEITRPLTFFDRLCRICFYFLSAVLLFRIYTKARRIYD